MRLDFMTQKNEKRGKIKMYQTQKQHIDFIEQGARNMRNRHYCQSWSIEMALPFAITKKAHDDLEAPVLHILH